MSAQYDHLFKLLILGDSGTGKSCLLIRFVEDSFTPSFITTIGIDFRVKQIELDGKKIKLQAWDSAGQERFRTITTAYYRGAMGILLVYDVTDERSFHNIDNWMKNIEEHASENVCKVLVANKIDVDPDQIVVSEERGRQKAEQYGIKFVTASAKTGRGVDDAFYTLAREVKSSIFDRMPPGANANTQGSGATGGRINVADSGINSAQAYMSSCCKT
ncbi:ras-domain-containing protein [Ramicandelaber brevisporus]|nr:ras-domain-containing protein [Ramicandelaber brevisporus]